MTRYFQVVGTKLVRSSKTREYTHAAVFVNAAGEPAHIASCSPSAAGADRNARGAYPRAYADGKIKVFPLVEITAKEARALDA